MPLAIRRLLLAAALAAALRAQASSGCACGVSRPDRINVPPGASFAIRSSFRTRSTCA